MIDDPKLASLDCGIRIELLELRYCIYKSEAFLLLDLQHGEQSRGSGGCKGELRKLKYNQSEL